MSSQAEKYRKNIKEYAKSPTHDPKVLAEMVRLLDYADTIDHDVASKASAILNSKELLS